MTISPLNINATISRTPDFLQERQNADQKASTDQNNIQQHTEKQTALKPSQVRSADNADNFQKKFDARDEGNGTYHGRNRDKKKKNEQQKEQKAPIAKGAFDIKI